MAARKTYQRAPVPVHLRFPIRMKEVDTSNRLACWHWPGHIQEFGYGTLMAGRRGAVKLHRAHIIAYEVTYGTVPDGLHIDHTCHGADLSCPGGPSCMHRRCVNPAHLEAVTQAENNRRMQARKTHCPQGHPYAGSNLYITPSSGGRNCRTCLAANKGRTPDPVWLLPVARSAAPEPVRLIKRCVDCWKVTPASDLTCGYCPKCARVMGLIGSAT